MPSHDLDLAKAQVVPAIELRPGMRTVSFFSFGPDDISLFARLSGDYNPLHFDDDYARSQGYEGRVVHGALLVAMVSRMIGMELPGRGCAEVGVTLNFHKPLYLGQQAQLEGLVANVSEGTGVATVRLAVRSGGQLLAKGKVDIVLTNAAEMDREAS